MEFLSQDSTLSGLNIDDITLILLLFADDMAFVDKSAEELQKAVGIDHRVTAAYKPSTNGAAEKANLSL